MAWRFTGRAHGMKKIGHGGACFITSAHAAPATAAAVLPAHPRVLRHLHGRTLDSHLQAFLLRSAPDRRPSSTPDLPAILQECRPKRQKCLGVDMDGTSYFDVFLSISRGGGRETKSCASPETRPR